MAVKNKQILFVLAVLLISFSGIAQTNPPPPQPPPPPGFPITEGLLWVAIVGLFYGIRRKIK